MDENVKIISSEPLTQKELKNYFGDITYFTPAVLTLKTGMAVDMPTI